MELINLKGTGDGVKIYLSADAPFSELINALHDKLDAWRKFFGTGHCNMYFIGRELAKSDTIRLEAVVHMLLPECTILYGEKKSMGDTVKLPEEFVKEINKKTEDAEMTRRIAIAETKLDGGETQNNDTEPVTETADEKEAEHIREFNQIREVVTTNFKSSRARLYEGVVRPGRVVESDGHLILVGNVEKGGTLIANGNVIVMGSLFGSVQAGCLGNREAYIIAMDMHPTDLRIAHVLKKYDNVIDNMTNFSKPKRAHLTNDEICIDEFLFEM